MPPVAGAAGRTTHAGAGGHPAFVGWDAPDASGAADPDPSGAGAVASNVAGVIQLAAARRWRARSSRWRRRAARSSRRRCTHSRREPPGSRAGSGRVSDLGAELVGCGWSAAIAGRSKLGASSTIAAGSGADAIAGLAGVLERVGAACVVDAIAELPRARGGGEAPAAAVAGGGIAVGDAVEGLAAGVIAAGGAAFELDRDCGAIGRAAARDELLAGRPRD